MNFDLNIVAFDKIGTWEIYSCDLLTELKQCIEEGKDVAALEAMINATVQLPIGTFREEIADIIFRELQAAPQRTDYKYVEPSDLPSIQARRPKNRMVKTAYNADILSDRINGAWYGRICGCLLGKPVEGYRTEKLHPLLKSAGNWPLNDYIAADPENPNRCWKDKIDGFAPVDDDTNYTVMAAVRLIERFGRNFTPVDMAKTWLDSQSIYAYCTAERVAFKNLTNGIHPPHSATYKNPYREWIGAQIRGDYFGYINPGDPETAANMAWRDASISHIKNGIYGEMWVSAMLAAAFVKDSIRDVIIAGLGEIPCNSRLAEDVGKILAWHAEGISEDECFKRIHQQWNEHVGHDWCHTNSNAMIVAASLLYGEGDYSKSICMAVVTGFDTDCNGATVGSVLGALFGMSIIDKKWTDPIQGTLDTSIMGVGKVNLDDMVSLTMKHIQNNK